MKKIFLIDGQNDIRQLLQSCLEHLDGYQVVAASEPAACPLYYSDRCDCPMGKPCGDALIVDNGLPTMSGLEFIRRQMAKGCKGSVRTKAVMSATFTAADIALAKELGCKLFSKPFRIKEIVAWVKRVAPASLTAV